jgi:hypothetical protein
MEIKLRQAPPGGLAFVPPLSFFPVMRETARPRNRPRLTYDPIPRASERRSRDARRAACWSSGPDASPASAAIWAKERDLEGKEIKRPDRRPVKLVERRAGCLKRTWSVPQCPSDHR